MPCRAFHHHLLSVLLQTKHHHEFHQLMLHFIENRDEFLDPLCDQILEGQGRHDFGQIFPLLAHQGIDVGQSLSQLGTVHSL